MYNLFISHAWKYGEDYSRLVRILDAAPGFYYKNYSAPEYKPLHNLDSTSVSSKMQIMAAIDRKIGPASCVLVISGMYYNNREWMKYEIDSALNYGKPIVAIVPWGNERIPYEIQKNATEIVRWNTSSIVAAIERCSSQYLR